MTTVADPKKSTLTLKLRLTNPKPSFQQCPPKVKQLDMATTFCSSSRCLHDDKHLTSNSERIEVCTVLPLKSKLQSFQSQLCVRWNAKGEATFHKDCWQALLKSARARMKKSTTIDLLAAEKEMIKLAAKTAETHDSFEFIASEAKRISQTIKQAEHFVVFTGAGISTSAGIGDFRGKSGKWTEEDRNKVDMDSVLEPEAKRSRLDGESSSNSAKDEDEDAESVPYEELRPTYTHEALSKLCELGYLKYIISQNADGLHLLSGIPSDKLSELHGNVFVEYCEKCQTRYHRQFYVMDDVACLYYEELADKGTTNILKPQHATECSKCGLNHRTGRKCTMNGCCGDLNDTIVNFCDFLDESILKRATEHAKKSDLMIVLGSSITVTPASDLVSMGKEPLRLVICNRQKTHLDAICTAKEPKSRKKLGSRIFGDCDVLMREIMKDILPPDDLAEWESAHDQRMAEYDKQRPKNS